MFQGAFARRILAALMPDAERLDVRVVREFTLSRRKAQDAIGAGQVDVGAVRVRDPGRRVEPSEAVTYNPNRRREAAVRLSLEAAYQDEDLVVVDKPPGLLTVPTDGGTNDDSVLSRLREDLARVRVGEGDQGLLGPPQPLCRLIPSPPGWTRSGVIGCSSLPSSAS